MIFTKAKPQIREQMSGSNLHVFTLKFLALKICCCFFIFPGQKISFKIFYKKVIVQHYSVFQKKRNEIFFLAPKK